MTEQEKQLEEMQKRFEAEQAKGGPISDKDYMEMFEVSDEEYRRGLGITLPATKGKK
jgi:hypothetical protein